MRQPLEPISLVPDDRIESRADIELPIVVIGGEARTETVAN